MRLFLRLIAVVASLVVAFAPADATGERRSPAAALQPCSDRSGDGTPTDSRSPWNLEIVEQFGAPAGALAVHPPNAYLAVGLRVQILGVADPTRPAFVSQTQIVPSPILSLRVNSATLYAMTVLGVHIFDVRDPLRPSLIAQVAAPGDAEYRRRQTLQLLGDVLYIPESEGYRIVDVAEPSSPREAGFVAMGRPYEAVLQRSLMYVGTTTGSSSLSLSIFDVSDPREPVLLGGTSSVGGRTTLAVYDETVYVTQPGSRGSVSVSMVDVSDPMDPKIVGRARGIGETVSAVGGGYLYTMRSTGFTRQLSVWNLSDAHEPALVTRFDTPGPIINVVDDRAYLAGEGRMQVVDVRDPTGPRTLGSYDVPYWSPRDIAGNGSFLYVADYGKLTSTNAMQPETGGIRVLDAADPARPEQVGSVLQERGSAVRIAQSGALGFAVFDPIRAQRGVSILGLSEPVRPRELAFIRDVGRSSGQLQAHGRYLFVDARLFDVSDPSFPLPAGAFQPLGANQAIQSAATDGSYLYLAVGSTRDNFGGQMFLRVFDIRDTASQTPLANVPMGQVRTLTHDGHYLYLFEQRREERIVQEYLQVWDVSDPAHPTQVAETTARSRPSRFQIVGGFGFAATSSGLSAYDLRNPRAPREIAFHGPPAGGGSGAVAVNGSWIYNVDGAGGGLMVMRFRPEDACSS
jgi:hypothetical protein